MKKIMMSFALLFILNFTYSASTCSGACGSGCLSWTIVYEVDCNGLITDFSAIYWHGGLLFEGIDSDTNPEFIGMNPANLGDHCEVPPCG